jgi:hypothetical protein
LVNRCGHPPFVAARGASAKSASPSVQNSHRRALALERKFQKAAGPPTDRL